MIRFCGFDWSIPVGAIPRYNYFIGNANSPQKPNKFFTLFIYYDQKAYSVWACINDTLFISSCDVDKEEEESVQERRVLCHNLINLVPLMTALRCAVVLYPSAVCPSFPKDRNKCSWWSSEWNVTAVLDTGNALWTLRLIVLIWTVVMIDERLLCCRSVGRLWLPPNCTGGLTADLLRWRSYCEWSIFHIHCSVDLVLRRAKLYKLIVVI